MVVRARQSFQITWFLGINRNKFYMNHRNQFNESNEMK